ARASAERPKPPGRETVDGWEGRAGTGSSRSATGAAGPGRQECGGSVAFGAAAPALLHAFHEARLRGPGRAVTASALQGLAPDAGHLLPARQRPDAAHHHEEEARHADRDGGGAGVDHETGHQGADTDDEAEGGLDDAALVVDLRVGRANRVSELGILGVQRRFDLFEHALLVLRERHGTSQRQPRGGVSDAGRERQRRYAQNTSTVERTKANGPSRTRRRSPHSLLSSCSVPAVTSVTVGTRDERGGADRAAAEPVRDLVHGSLGLTPAAFRLVEGELTGGLAGGAQVLDPDSDQPETYPVQPCPLIEGTCCDIDHTGEVGRLVQRPRPRDRREVRLPQLDAHRPA